MTCWLMLADRIVSSHDAEVSHHKLVVKKQTVANDGFGSKTRVHQCPVCGNEFVKGYDRSGRGCDGLNLCLV